MLQMQKKLQELLPMLPWEFVLIPRLQNVKLLIKLSKTTLLLKQRLEPKLILLQEHVSIKKLQTVPMQIMNQVLVSIMKKMQGKLQILLCRIIQMLKRLPVPKLILLCKKISMLPMLILSIPIVWILILYLMVRILNLMAM